MSAHRNVTLSLPDPLLRRFRVYAAQRNQSMTSLMADAIRDLLDSDSRKKQAGRRLIAGMRNSPDRGTGGTVTWTRDELHDRSIL